LNYQVYWLPPKTTTVPPEVHKSLTVDSDVSCNCWQTEQIAWLEYRLGRAEADWERSCEWVWDCVSLSMMWLWRWDVIPWS